MALDLTASSTSSPSGVLETSYSTASATFGSRSYAFKTEFEQSHFDTSGSYESQVYIGATGL